MAGWRTLGLLLALALIVSCSGPGSTTSGAPGGPLRSGNAYVSYRDLDPIGSTFSEGMLVLGTTEPITLESVTVTGGDEALEYLGALVGMPGRPNDFAQFMHGFPPTEHVPMRYQQPAAGTRLEAGETYMLIVGYRVKTHVIDLRRAITVNYTTDDGTKLMRTYPAGVVTCPPSDTPDCMAAAEAKYGDVLQLLERATRPALMPPPPARHRHD